MHDSRKSPVKIYRGRGYRKRNNGRVSEFIKKSGGRGRASAGALEKHVRQRTAELATLNLILTHEITERKRAEEALVKSRNSLQAIIDAVPIPIFVKDLDGVYQLVNQSYENLHGREKNRVIGNTVHELFPKDLAQKYDDMDRLLFQAPGSIQKYDSEFRTSEPRVLDVTKYKSAYFDSDGECQGLIGVIFDITEQKKAEAALNESEKKFRSIIESSPVGIHMYHLMEDDRLIFTEANPAADRLLKRRHKDLIGLTVEDAFPNLAETNLPFQFKMIAREGGVWTTTQIDQDNDELKTVYEINAFQTSPQKLVAMFLDITERKRAETELRKAHDELEKRVQERTAALASLNAELRHEVVERRIAEEAVQNRLQILTRPGNVPEKLTFTDLFTVQDLQTIQEAFARATNVASIITYPDGRPVTQPSNFCRLCREIIRASPYGFSNCMRSDAVIGRPNPDGPIMQPCLSGGLWDGGASICVGDQHLASWLAGQVRDSSMSEKRLIKYARQIGVDPDQALEALAEVPKMSRKQFAQICKALFLIANQMSQLAMQNILQARAISARLAAEKALRQSEKRLQHLSTKLLIAQEEERKKLAAELHDGIGQSLAAAKYGVDSALQGLIIETPQKETLKTSADVLKTVIHEVRRMQTELRPQVLDDLGIVATINWFCRKYQAIYAEIDVRKTIDIEESSIPGVLKPVIFRIVQEAMNNVAKHSGAAMVHLKMGRRREELVLEISDNGVGFVQDEASLLQDLEHGGLGLDSMRERAELSGGKLEIKTRRWEGDHGAGQLGRGQTIAEAGGIVLS